MCFWKCEGRIGEDNVEGGETLWKAVQIVVIADIVMSLDNVIAIAASADIAAARVDIAHAAVIKTTLIVFGVITIGGIFSHWIVGRSRGKWGR